MRSVHRVSAARVLAAAVCGAFVLAAPATARAEISRAASPTQSRHDLHELVGVGFASATDGWAVGLRRGGDSGKMRTRIRHWDGENWVLTPSRGPGVHENYLTSVAAISATDAWAVGEFRKVNGTAVPLIEHWDGSAWTVVRAPLRQGDYSSVSAASADDVWAVGDPWREGASPISHWDGLTWTKFPSPLPNKENILFSVDAYASDDAWAVGGTFGYGIPLTSLVEHWDGTTWSVVDGSAQDEVYLQAVNVVSPDDVWAVGRRIRHTEERSVIGHWDGRVWSWVDAPPTRYGRDRLNAVTAVSADDVWAVGYQGRPVDTAKTLVEHWDGENWSIVPSPNRARTDVRYQWNELVDVVASSPDDVWSVGWFRAHGSSKTKPIIQHWDGTRWTNYLHNK